MKKMFFLGIVLLMGCFACTAQDDSLTPGAALLFKDVGGNLTNMEKNEIFKLSQFEIAKDGTQFSSIGDEGTAEYPFGTQTYPVDINLDGTAEVFVIWGNSFTSGMYGSNTTLFIKNEAGNYVANFGFPSSLILTAPKNKEYPNILLGGPGLEPYGVWRWNGEMYDGTNETIEQDKAEKIGVIYIEDASKNYIDSIKN